MSSPTPSRPRQRLTPTTACQLVEQLPQRERLLLRELARLRLATTQQLARLVCPEPASEIAMRLVRRHLQRLIRSGLVRRFANRARDRKVGAPGHLYALTMAGVRAMRAGTGIGTRQRKAYRPSEAFLDHRLAITELYVQLREQERGGGAAVREFASEPDSWREATGPAGEPLIVKPDALIRLAIGELEVSWFVEVDRGDTDRNSESTTVIAAKCRVYMTYELSGVEQQRHSVFPGVIFVVPSGARARQITKVIANLPANARDLFAVATADEALAVMTHVEEDAA